MIHEELKQLESIYLLLNDAFYKVLSYKKQLFSLYSKILIFTES